MKNIWLSMAVATALVFTGCAQTPVEKSAVEPTTEPTAEQTVAETTADTGESAVQNSDELGLGKSAVLDEFTVEFKEALKAEGMQVGDVTPKDGESIGAKAGNAIALDNSSIEFYEFDPLSQDEKTVANLDSLKNKEEMIIYGVEVNGESVHVSAMRYGNIGIYFPTETIPGLPVPDKERVKKALGTLANE